MTAPRDPDADDLALLAVGFGAALLTGILGAVWIRRRLW